MYDKTLIYILKQRVLWPSTGDATSQVTMKVSGAQGHKRLFPEVLVVSKCLLNHVTDKIRNKKRDMPICCLNLCFVFGLCLLVAQGSTSSAVTMVTIANSGTPLATLTANRATANLAPIVPLQQPFQVIFAITTQMNE